jgi:hypothetical protein
MVAGSKTAGQSDAFAEVLLIVHQDAQHMSLAKVSKERYRPSCPVRHDGHQLGVVTAKTLGEQCNSACGHRQDPLPG